MNRQRSNLNLKKSWHIFFNLNVVSVISLIFSTTILCWSLHFCNYGIDLTDEGLYLNWISHPFNYSASSSQFGFVYHPLYILFNGDISSLRQANIYITFTLASLAVWLFLKKSSPKNPITVIHNLAVSAAIGTTSLVSLIFNGMWLATPSYNTLTFQGLLIVTLGITLLKNYPAKISVLGSLLIGIGGALIFLAKPTSAAALAILLTPYFLFSKKLTFKELVISGSASITLIIFSAFCIDGSLKKFFERYEEGLVLANLLTGGGYDLKNIFRLDSFLLGKQFLKFFGSFALGMSILIYQVNIYVEGISRFRYVSVTALGILFSFGALFYFPIQSLPSEQRALLIFSIPVASMLAGFFMLFFQGRPKSDWTLPFPCLILLALPYIYAFGSGNNYWILFGATGFFAVFATLLIYRMLASNKKYLVTILITGFSVQALVVVLLNGGFESPYRQPKTLYAYKAIMDIGRNGSTLIISNGFATYLSSLSKIAYDNGFSSGTPIIDLSGHSPGAIYSIGAKSIGSAWLIGGYVGTTDYVIQSLKKVSCLELSSSWVLAEPTGMLAIPSDVLNSFGANLADDFKLVGKLQSTSGQLQYLYKPTRDIADADNRCNLKKDK